MSPSSKTKTDPTKDTGVADVRLVREKIARQYGGDLRRHVAETEKIVAPLIEWLGLKKGTPRRSDDRRSGTGG